MSKEDLLSYIQSLPHDSNWACAFRLLSNNENSIAGKHAPMFSIDICAEQTAERVNDTISGEFFARLLELKKG